MSLGQKGVAAGETRLTIKGEDRRECDHMEKQERGCRFPSQSLSRGVCSSESY